MFKVKILIVGPAESGKTVLSNFLSEATETFGDRYHPTQGVRITEFDLPGIPVGGRNVKADVELWDCSGDHKFESCWPAIAKDTNGVLFVFDPTQSNYDKELESWYEYFVDQQGLRESQVMVFAHYKSKGEDDRIAERDITLPSTMNNVSLVHTNLVEGAEEVRDHFQNFVASLLVTLTEKREQDELSIMNSR